MMKRLKFISALLVLWAFCVLQENNTAIKYNEIASDAMGQGDFAQARDLYLKALDLVGEEDSAAVAVLLGNLSVAYQNLSEYHNALRCVDKALSYSEGFDGCEIAAIEDRKASILMELGHYEKALRSWEHALERLEAGTAEYNIFAGNYAAALMEMGMLKDAQFVIADLIYDAASPEDSLYAFNLYAKCNALRGMEERSLTVLSWANGISARIHVPAGLAALRQTVVSGDINELCGRYEDAIELYRTAYRPLCTILGDNHPESISVCYGIARCARMLGDKDTAGHFYSKYLSAKVAYLATRIDTMPSEDIQTFWDRNSEGIDDAPLYWSESSASEILNTVMFSKNLTFFWEKGSFDNALAIPDWHSVVSSMDSGSTAVEFVHYHLDTDGQYGAIVFRKGNQSPEMVDLFSDTELRTILPEDYNSSSQNVKEALTVEAMEALGELIWSPLKNYISGKDEIFFSPAQRLNVIPVEYLPLDGKSLFDVYDGMVFRMVSTADIWKAKHWAGFDRIFLFGDIDYFNTESDRSYFSRLAGTRQEIEFISGIMEDYNPQCFSAGRATERNFRDIDFGAQNPSILHFSTHGYCFSAQEAAGAMYYRDIPEGELEEKPMLRTGLALSGANFPWNGLNIHEPSDDGILTALEISRMNLDGVSLTVLSACQTGLGDIGGEGVRGLQRAFRLAGSELVMVSLWNISDMATCALMIAFYSGLAEGLTPWCSLARAQQDLKMQGLEEPYYYAPFVIVS